MKEDFKKAIELLKLARCPDEDCDNKGTVAVRISDDEWGSHQCQWCYERNDLMAKLDALSTPPNPSETGIRE